MRAIALLPTLIEKLTARVFALGVMFPTTQMFAVQPKIAIVDMYLARVFVGGGYSHKLTTSWWVNGPRLYFLYSFLQFLVDQSW